MSSNDPNLQNIPTGSGYPDLIKSCFIPSVGNILIVADYSQIELRILAFLSQDHGLLEAFEQGEDIHTRTARFLFQSPPLSGEVGRGTSPNPSYREGDDPWKPTSEQRRIAKTVNF